jgi:hypothetical protein
LVTFRRDLSAQGRLGVVLAEFALCDDSVRVDVGTLVSRKRVMRKRCLHVALVALLEILVLAGINTRSLAETGSVALVFTKGGLILGVGAGEGVLTFRGKHYPFTVSGLSVGATVGASTTRLVGHALNLREPESLAGRYSAVGAGGALAGGAGSVRLRNTTGGVTTNGVVLQLSGLKAGIELSVAVAGVDIQLK